MERLLELGGDKKYLTFDDLNRELPDTVVSPDDIEDVLQNLKAQTFRSAILMKGCLSRLLLRRLMMKRAAIRTSNSIFPRGTLEKTNDPVRLYLREMGVVPLLTREGEVPLPKGSNAASLKTQKAISRSPIAVKELLKIGEELQSEIANIREIVIFSEQAELTGDEDKAEEYRAWTIEGIENIRKVFKQGLKDWDKLRAEQKATRGKKSKKLMRLRRKVARMRLGNRAGNGPPERHRARAPAFDQCHSCGAERSARC